MNKDIRPDKTSPAYLKNKNSGGLFKGFLYVLLFMSILGLALWQNYASSSSESKIKSAEDRLAIIEEQMNIADEINNDSLTDISSSIQFLDKEIRKLWDLSNKRNKVNISKLTDSNNDLKESIKDINQLLSDYKKNIESNTRFISEVEPTIVKFEDIERKLKLLETQLMIIDDSVQALNNYKKQLNQSILEIQTEISILNQENEVIDILN
jgi:chromosome segregation ATPase|tara:strand:+ start:1424 stop:2053 length:630 start_codon:yes stop_codon:yes gene_type:complete